MESQNGIKNFPRPTIKRYPRYLMSIKQKIKDGAAMVSSAVLAKEFNLDPVLTRKDLAMTGVQGTPRNGYPAKELAEAITRALGQDNKTMAVLIGVGSLGKALLGYQGFKEQNISISAAFDASPNLIGETVHGHTIHSMDKLAQVIKKNKIEIGILTVPNTAAQECADMLVRAGVRGIWNFTQTQLALPGSIAVERIDLAQSLAVLSHKITRG